MGRLLQNPCWVSVVILKGRWVMIEIPDALDQRWIFRDWVTWPVEGLQIQVYMRLLSTDTSLLVRKKFQYR